MSAELCFFLLGAKRALLSENPQMRHKSKNKFLVGIREKCLLPVEEKKKRFILFPLAESAQFYTFSLLIIRG